MYREKLRVPFQSWSRIYQVSYIHRDLSGLQGVYSTPLEVGWEMRMGGGEIHGERVDTNLQ